MKSDELVRKINNGEIKDGAKIDRYRNGRKELRFYFDNYTLKYDSNGEEACADVLLDNDAEFEIVEEHKGWFKPKGGEEYYYIDCDGIYRSDIWREHKSDIYRYEHHNCFRTQEEAQECDEYREALKKAEKPFVDNKYNYFIIFDPIDNKLEADYVLHGATQGVVHLGQDKKVAQAFIDKWKKQILKFEFDVWE